MKFLATEAYSASIHLGAEKGSFPLYDKEKFNKTSFVLRIIKEIGDFDCIRNSTLLTIAPVGSGSIVAECSSGMEPIFATSYKRRVKQKDGKTFKEFTEVHPLIAELFGTTENLPKHIVTAHDIDYKKRIDMQATLQHWVDASISSTINLPENAPKKVVEDIYWYAYEKGLKGITVYREGSREDIIKKSSIEEKKKSLKRSFILEGFSSKIKVADKRNIYIHVNGFENDFRRPFEVFVNSHDYRDMDLVNALCTTLSALFRREKNIDFLIKQFKKIRGSEFVWWYNPITEKGTKVYGIPHAIAIALELFQVRKKRHEPFPDPVKLRTCPECGEQALKMEEGCETCLNCGHSKCG